MNGSDAHKNNFTKTTEYLASFVQHGKGRGRKISAFHAQDSIYGRHGGCFGRDGRVREGHNGKGGQCGRGGSGGREAKSDISARS